jgi:DNA primase catalytic core
MMADNAWPALVAAIHARPSEWTAEQLITAVADHHGPAVPAEELCSALVWRVATMTDPPPEPEDVQETEPSFPEVKALNPVNESVHTPFAPAPGTSVDRIIELNRWALEHYSRMYPRSWAPNYLRDRIGTDLTGETRFAVGYSPPGPVSLSRHLSSRGATQVELIEAGLAKRTDNGLLIDAFRDRIIFPIYSGADLVGFIGRRNPTLDDSTYAGPKYLNTRTTAAFAKGRLLFGLTEGAGALATGATPVLVEGPLDAIAVSLAAPERAVGIAPLGTAFTEAQAVQLKPYFKDEPSCIVIATDPDAAGWAAAQKAFWQLASLAADPKHFPLPPGVDPADVLRTHGTPALARLLERTQNFGTRLLACMVDDADLPDVAARLWLARDIARVIVALPPDEWIAHVDRATEQLDLPAGMLNLEVLDATETWSQDPAHEVRRQTGRLTAKMAADAERAQASSARGHLSVSRRPTSRRSTHTPPTASRRHGLPR